MKQSWVWMGLLLAAACGGDDAKKSEDGDADGDGDGDSHQHEDAGQHEEEDAGGGDDGDGDGEGGDAGAACVDDSSETVSDPGMSCSASIYCTHYIGDNWAEADVLADCEMTAARASATACMNEGFCARTADVACKIEAEGKVKYIFGLGDPICGYAMGTVVAKPEAGWPESYADL
jgi:hypothetical protein